MIINAFYRVGMTGFELATSRPPDVYSNRTELHPDFVRAKVALIFEKPKVFVFFLAAHGFAIEVEHIHDFFFGGRLVNADIAYFAHQGEIDDACAVLLVVSHKFV